MVALTHFDRSVSVDWRILIENDLDASVQMARDEALAGEAPPTLRLFRWRSPAVSLGYKQARPLWADPVMVAAAGVECVERPTGGGIAVHGSDLSCAVIMPRAGRLRLDTILEATAAGFLEMLRAFDIEADWMRWSSQRKRIAYCLTQPSPYAVMVGGRKLCGFAARRYLTSWLVQGSMLVQPLPAVFEHLMPREVWTAYQHRAITLEEAAGRPISQEEIDDKLVRAWRSSNFIRG